MTELNIQQGILKSKGYGILTASFLAEYSIGSSNLSLF